MMEERFPWDSHPQEKEAAYEQDSNTIELKYFAGFIFQDPRFRVLKVRSKLKEPMEKSWNTTNNYAFDSEEINQWIKQGGNYGITCPRGDCAFIDADTKQIQDVLDSGLPTFWFSTGRTGHRQYVYTIRDPPMRSTPLKDGGYIKALGGYSLGPGSIHPSGRIYGLEKSNLPIREVSKQELLGALEPFLIRKNEPQRNRPVINKSTISWISLSDIIDLSKFKRFGSQYQGPSPIHGSLTGRNLSINVERNLWHCFRHDSGGGPLQWIAVAERIINCEDSVPGGLRGDKFWQALEVAHVKYGLTTEAAVKMLKVGSKNEF
ncbi:MAG: bifunctional DNA primase/polymerase [Candidatus Parvarchaeota archaeon]